MNHAEAVILDDKSTYSKVFGKAMAGSPPSQKLRRANNI